MVLIIKLFPFIFDGIPFDFFLVNWVYFKFSIALLFRLTLFLNTLKKNLCDWSHITHSLKQQARMVGNQEHSWSLKIIALLHIQSQTLWNRPNYPRLSSVSCSITLNFLSSLSLKKIHYDSDLETISQTLIFDCDFSQSGNLSFSLSLFLFFQF